MHVDAMQLPGFASVEQLYAGTRSTVYRARADLDGRPVVLKVAHAGPATLDESLARLRHEMTLLSSIRSDRVIRALDVVRVGHEAALVLEDVGGESLDRHLSRARFSVGDALGLAVHVVAALRDVHAAGIIHKDVTPNNVVYNPATGQARLIDFDVATAWRTERPGFTAPAALEGTLLYMAPEQTGRMNRIIDSRADLYSFGVTLFELLTGQTPFVETDILAIVHAHLAVRPPAPDALDPAIPRPLAAIVTKLLAKAPEDRYQTAIGLLADLETCVERLAGGAIDDFALGRGDVATRFELPTRLYGRRAERDVLAHAFERVAAGGVEIAMVSGTSGVGKTSVVRELFPLITRERGYFLSGKFDQLRGDAPYPALVAAFDGLVHQLLTESEDALAAWRGRILAAIAPNAQIVVDAIPALGRILGPQPPVVALDAAGTRSRFHGTLQKLIQVFTRRSHPVVLFLDDMQWADPDSLQLLTLVALSGATESLLLIQAFRDGEMQSGHPLLAAARELAAHRPVIELAIAPLSSDDVAALLADALHREVGDVAQLAHLLRRKTDGNPFFVRQLLFALHEAGHIAFDPVRRQFAFDAASIERAPISENVADLLADSLRKLPEPTQRVLAIAAAIGNHFELDLLALVADASPVAIQSELAAALREELVVPASDLEYVASARGSGLVFPRLRFQHDRVQRAAYEQMSAEDQQRLHLRIGELLLATAEPTTQPRAELGDRLFEVVSHWNRAVALLDTPARRLELARLDVAAAHKARASGAYAAAVDLLGTATACFDWRTEHAEQLAAHRLLAECCYLAGDARRATGVLDAAEPYVRHSRDRSTLEALRATLHIHAGDMAAAVRSTVAAAALLGRTIPTDPAALGPALEAAVGEILHGLAGREIEALIDLPEMTDLDALALMTVLRNACPAAYQVEAVLGAFMTTQMVLLSLEHGNGPASAYAYGTLAGVLLMTPLHELAHRFSRLGLDLNHRRDDRAARPSLEFLFALFSAPWRLPIEEAIRHFREAGRIGREVADHIHADNAGALEISLRMFAGNEPLADLAADARRYLEQCREVNDLPTVRLLTWQIDRMRVLTGEIDSLGDDEDSHVTLVTRRGETNTAQQFNLLHVLVDTAYTTGDPAAALELATATRLLEASVPRMVMVVDHQFWHALAAIAVCRRRTDRCGELEPVIDGNLRELARCAEACPANFEAMQLLIEAERSTLDSDVGASMALFDRATASSARHSRRRLEALANELQGRMWLSHDKPEIAQIYLTRARGLYAGLGYLRKVRQLETEHPALVRSAPARLAGTVTSTTAAEVLDVTAIAVATRTLSGELELDNLLARMLEIIFKSAGAEGGAFVQCGEGALVVVALRSPGAAHTSTAPVALAAAALPRSLIHYVQRTESVVVLDDALADRRFGNDDDIRRRAPRSVLCMPVKHKDRMLGMLYLENTLVTGAFTESRLEALNILASQLAVSLENARLFAALRVHTEALTRANEELRSQIAVREQAERELAGYRNHLEDLIAERTRELTLANQRLRDAAAERERIEAELRLAQKLESVGRLAAGIAHEINTPVQFVSDQVAFVRDALPGMVDAFGRYRELAAAADAAAVDADDDADYALGRTPAALDAALEGLGRVAAIVRSMKDFAHPDRDEKAPVDLNRAIESTLMIAAHECKYVADVATDFAALPLVRCNAGEINQAVLNLVINAAHAIRDVVGESGARGRIDVRTRCDGGEVEIAIRDTGTGIADGIRDKIYDPFFTTKEVGRGTGQGLAIVRSVVVDKHGGSLRFETAPGTGTTFFVRLPIGDLDAAACPAAADDAALASP